MSCRPAPRPIGWAAPLAAALACWAVLLVPGRAAAAPVGSNWATWGPITGSSHDYRITMALPAPGFPEAAVTTDSRGPVALPSGASTFLGDTGATATPVGIKYGSSRDHAYLNLRPEADTPDAPSTTTYTFASGTPNAGWTFVLGDIDSDRVRISATTENGSDVTAARIADWYRGSFNYVGGTDTPSFDASTSTLEGNAAAVDTEGASAWFEPDIALSTLTFTFTRRAGFPIYQTWFASRTHVVSGTVSDASAPGGHCDLGSAKLTLTAATGEHLATTTAASDGSYSFGPYTAAPGYRVTVQAPGDCVIDGADSREISLQDADATADFAVRAIVAQPVSGTVSSEGRPVDGATVTVTDEHGERVGADRTDSTGVFRTPPLPPGRGYVATVTAPPGYRVAGAPNRRFDITDHAVDGLTFRLEPAPTGASSSHSGGGSSTGAAANSDTGVTSADTGVTPTATADTGLDAGALLIVAAGLLATGTLLTVGGRRRTGRRSGATAPRGHRTGLP